MLNLEHHLKITKEVIDSPNLCDRFTESDLRQIADLVYQDYQQDVQSRQQWMRRMSAAMDLAMQVQKDKNFPWPNCSNVAFPLITIAALQFHSRAYPAIMNGNDIVQMRVIGPDPDGQKTQRAERVSCHMSWQLTEQDESWEEQLDRSLLVVPIVGIAWKKSYYDGGLGQNCSELVMPQDLVLNYWAKSVETCPVKTHIIPLSKNEMHSRILRGVFCDVRNEEWYEGGAPQPKQTAESAEANTRMGMQPPQIGDSTPFIALEQHRWLDLDGDGYAEPYIVTIDEGSQAMLRIVARFDREEDIEYTKDGEIISIRPTEYFTKIPFIPSPDGSIMDVGFGTLLGPLNEATNGAINQLIDAGTMSNTAGGFLGRGAKIRGGVYNFSPFEWTRVDSTGDDIKKSVLPLPVREPSNVLFQLLSLLINYTEKVSGSVEITTGGNPGQNTPAQTSQTMVEQGQKVYAAIFKRIWRSLKQEFKKLYQLNGIHLPPDNVLFGGSTNYISKGDYLDDPGAVCPVADPNIMSDQQKFLQASALMNVGRGNPLFNQDALYKNFLKALKVSNIEQIYIGTEKAPPAPPSEKIQVEQLKKELQEKNLEWKKLQWISTLLEQRRLNEAKIVNLYAQAALLEKQAGGAEAATQIEAFKAMIDGLKTFNESIGNQINLLGGMPGDNQDQQGGTGAGSSDAGGGSVSPMASAGADGQLIQTPPQ